MDILSKMKDVMFWMDQVSPDKLPKMEGYFFNKGKNELQDLIADGERRQYEKMDEMRGDPIG